MKTQHLIIILVSLLATPAAFSQAVIPIATLPTVKVDIKDVKFESIETPRLQASNLPEKSWRPKKWMQIDVHFNAKKAKTGDTNPYIDALEFKYYISLNVADAVTKKYILLTSTINYVNINSKEIQSHALAFVSPASISRLLGKTDFTGADVKAVAIEVSYGGQLVGGHNQGAAGKWWDDLSKFTVIDGNLLPKNKTPYAPYWGDYDVDVKAQ